MPQSAERFRSLSKSKGRTVWFVLLRLSKNFVFRTVSRSKPRFRAKPKKNRALRAHFFFPCINSEIHAPGIYEFAKQIRLNACCRTKHKNQILLFRQAKIPFSTEKGIFLCNSEGSGGMPPPAVPQRICTITNQNLQIKHNAAYRADQDKHDRMQFFELPDTERQHEENNYRRNIDD